MADLREKILHHLNEAQNGLHQHHKLIKSLKSVLEQESPSTKVFFDAFLPPILNVLLVLKREPAAERLVEFVAKFSIAVAPKKSRRQEGDDESSSSSSDEESSQQDNFLQLLFTSLAGFLEAKEKSVRFRVCQILSKTFAHSLSDPNQQVTISSTLSNTLAELLLNRLMDRFQLVRLHAVSALSFLQDPGDADCPVTAALIWSMEHDSSYEVRKCAVLNILMTKNSLPAVINRTRDVHEQVRRCAFLTLSEKCSIRNLTIEQRLRIVGDGLRDDGAQVKQACIGGLLRSWCMELDEDLLQLLRRLDVENSPDVAELVLMSLFEEIGDEDLVSSFEGNLSRITGEGEDGEKEQEKEDGEKEREEGMDRLLPLDELSCELVFYWRCLCKYFKQKPAEGEGLSYFDRVTPTLSHFCGYIQSFLENEIMLVSEQTLDSQLSGEFIARQLCGLLSSLDFTDEMGKRLLSQLFHQLIANPVFPVSLISPLLVEQVSIWPQESFRIERLIEIITEIRSSGVTSVDHSNTESELSYDDLKDDVTSLMKCLVIAGELFKELTLKQLTPPLVTLLDSLLIPCIQNENPYVRDLAVFALGLACLLDINLARRHFLLFIQVSQVDHENVQATALKVVFDLLHNYGLEAFNVGPETREEDRGDTIDDETRETEVSTELLGDELEQSDNPDSDEGKTTAQKFLHILTSFLDGESSFLHELVSEGLAKLLLSGRIASIPLLVRLLLIWYNPRLREEDKLRVVLGYFFPAYAAIDTSRRSDIAEMYVPAMQAIFDAPPESPLVDVDVSNVAKFIINLSAPHQTTEGSAHDELAVQVMNRLLSGDFSEHVDWMRIHCRSLTLMQLSTNNTSNVRDILTLLSQLQTSIQDKQSLKSLKKFKTVLDKSLPFNEDITPVTGTAAIDSNKENIQDSPVQQQLLQETTPIHKFPEEGDAHTHQLSRSQQLRPVCDEEFTVSGSVNKSLKKQRSKRSTRKKKKEKAVTEQYRADDDREEESDNDSLIGEHSPFVKGTCSKRPPSPRLPLFSN